MRFVSAYLQILILLCFSAAGCGGGSSGTDSGGSIKIKGLIKADINESSFNVTVIETGDQAISDDSGNFTIDTSKTDSELTLLVSKDDFENTVRIPNSNFSGSTGDKVVSVSINVNTANDAITIISLYIENKRVEVAQPEETNTPAPRQQETSVPAPTAAVAEENYYGSIEGKIISLKGIPVSGVLVKLEKAANLPFIYTDSDGKFRIPFFSESPKLILNIIYRSKGFSVDLPVLPRGKSRLNINLLLKTAADIIDRQIAFPEERVNSGTIQESVKVINRRVSRDR